MRHKRILVISFFIAFMFGIPINWMVYKGETNLSTVFQLFSYNPNNVFYDFSLLFLNTLILYGIFLFFVTQLKKIKPKEDAVK